jgi:hypothetical protein
MAGMVLHDLSNRLQNSAGESNEPGSGPSAAKRARMPSRLEQLDEVVSTTLGAGLELQLEGHQTWSCKHFQRQ